MTLMKISQKGIDLIKKFEGCKLYAYSDSVGIPTIGYGHTNGVKMGMCITQKQADDFLRDDVTICEKALNTCRTNFTQNQFDALCSWIFNLGTANFNSSTMRKYIVARKSDVEITDQLIKWHNAGGNPLTGLKRRRVAEANMFLGKELYTLKPNGDIIKK